MPLTQILMFHGQCEDDGRVTTTYSEHVDEETGKSRKLKSVVTIRSTSMCTFEYYEEEDSGEFRKTAEVIYTRQI